MCCTVLCWCGVKKIYIKTHNKTQMRFTRIARTASSTLDAFLSDNVVHESYASCVGYCRGSHLTPRESRASCQGSRCQIQPSASRRHRPRRRSALTRRLSAAISHACAARRSRCLRWCDDIVVAMCIRAHIVLSNIHSNHTVATGHCLPRMQM